MILSISTAAAQDLTVEGFRGSRYSPPVHIPPRVPLYDPGLPESLNGKFNSTHQIRSGRSQTGTRTTIGDVATESYQDQRDNYRQQSQRRPQQQIAKNQPRRRAGLQDKISNLISSNQPAAIGTGAIRNERQSQEGSYQARLEQSVAATVELLNRPGRFANTQVKPRVEQRQQVVPRQLAGPRVNSSFQANNQDVLRHPQATNPKPLQRKAVQQQVHNRRLGQVGTGLRQIPSQLAASESGTRGEIQRTAMQEPVFAEPQETSSFVPPESAPQPPASAWTAQAQQQRTRSQLPPAIKQRAKAKAVSVLNRNDGELSLEPSPELSNSMESFEPAEFNEPEAMVPTENSLRESFVMQEDEGELLDPADEDMDLDSSFATEDRNSDSNNPLRKSCDEFRTQLLTRPITDIALDISPPANTDIFGPNLFRVWRDQNGNELAQGTISDIRRGYLIIDSANGQIRIPYARLNDADWMAVSDYWRLPTECGLGPGNFAGRNWVPQTVHWHASSLCHKPLYFENIQLERYGHSYGPFLQPVASAGHFFGKLFFLPYNTAINPPNECQYALGFYRPGNCAPWLRDPFPISLRGATRQAGIYAGFAALTN